MITVHQGEFGVARQTSYPPFQEAAWLPGRIDGITVGYLLDWHESNRHTMTHSVPSTYNCSVVICAYTEKRWRDLVAAIESLRRQSLRPTEVIVVVDHNPSLLERVQTQLDDVIAVEIRGCSALAEPACRCGWINSHPGFRRNSIGSWAARIAGCPSRRRPCVI